MKKTKKIMPKKGGAKAKFNPKKFAKAKAQVFGMKEDQGKV